MNLPWQAIGIGVAVFVVLLVVWLLSRKKSGATQSFTGNVSEAANKPATIVDTQTIEQVESTPGDYAAEVRMLIDYGNKAAAIRVLREKMGLDLKDAKDLADKLEQGIPVPMESAGVAPATANDADRELRDLVNKGYLIEAIKLVREKKGLDLKDAKAYVERLQSH